MSNQQISAPIGIDIGTYTSKIAVAKRGGVEIITNQANFRQTPCIVGYGPAQRSIGQAGSIKMKSNFKDTISYPSRFLGLQADYPMLRSQKKFVPAKCITKDDKIAFQVKYQGQVEQLFPEQIFAAYINKLKLILQKNNFDNKSGVIAVPTYFTQQERKSIFDAAKIAQFSITRLINQSTAISLDYGMFRKNQLDATNHRNVLFIDFGHSKLSLFACGFTNSQMNVLEQEHYRHIGCRDIDYHVYQFYRGIFQKSSGGSDISQNKKAIVKLMQNIEKQRKTLSGNIEHDLNIQYLMDQCDLHYTMTRQQFEKISEPIFQAIIEALNNFKNNLTAKKINLHSIELIGGGSRIPAVVHLIKTVFGVQPSRTLNSSQSVARGCALMAAIKSPLFRVPDYTLNQKVYYGVKFYWNFVQGEKLLGLDSSLYPQKQGKFIYEAGAKVPTSKTIKFTRKQAIQILIEYESVNGFNKHLGYYVTKPQNPKEQTFSVSFKIKFTQDGLVVFDQCSLVEQYFEETKTPKKKEQKKKEQKKQGQPQKMEEQQFDVKKTKKQRYSAIKFEANTFEKFTPKQIQTFFTIESTMVNQDKLIIQTYEKKNELESSIYNWKEKLNGSHQKFAKPNEIPQIIAFLQQQNQWLYNEGQNSNRGTYTDRINSVKAKVSHIQKKYDNFQATVGQIKNLGDCLKNNISTLNNLDKKYEHITPQQRQEGFSHIERIKVWFTSAQQKQKTRPYYEDPVINVQQIKEQMKQINEKVKKIMSKPAPAPPKVQQKKEQPKQQKKKQESAQGSTMQTQKNEPEKMDVQ